MRSNNCIIKEIEIASFRGRRVYHDMHIVICIHLSGGAFCKWPLRALLSKESTKSLIIHEVVPDINWRDSTCRQFFLFFFFLFFFLSSVKRSFRVASTTSRMHDLTRGCRCQKAAQWPKTQGRDNTKREGTKKQKGKSSSEARCSHVEQMYISNNVMAMNHQLL